MVRDGNIKTQPSSEDFLARYDFTFKKGDYAPAGKYEDASDVIVEDVSEDDSPVRSANPMHCLGQVD